MAAAAVTVRLATASDLDDLLRLYDQLADHRAEAATSPEDGAALLDAIIRQPGRALLVAVQNGRVVGTADLVVVANLTHGGRPWAIIEGVVVDSEVRRNGVGRVLMAEVLRRTEDAGCYKVQLLSRKDRHGAHEFYRSVGMEPLAEGFRRYAD